MLKPLIIVSHRQARVKKDMTWQLYRDTETWKSKRKTLTRAHSVDSSVLDKKLANLMRNVGKKGERQVSHIYYHSMF